MEYGQGNLPCQIYLSKSALSSRFKEERIRLGLNQTQVGELCGVSKNSVISWEKGAKIPADSLARLMAVGFDVVYVLIDEHLYDVTLKALKGPDRIKATLERVLDVQEDMGYEFTPEQLKVLMGYTNEHCPTHEQLKAFVEAAFAVVGASPERTGSE